MINKNKAPREAMVAALAFMPTKCTLTLPWRLKAEKMLRADLAVLILIKDVVYVVGIEVIASDEALQVKLIVCSFCVGCHNAYELWRKVSHLTIFAFCRLSKSSQNSACSSSLNVFEAISLRISSNSCIFVTCRSGATSIW